MDKKTKIVAIFLIVFVVGLIASSVWVTKGSSNQYADRFIPEGTYNVLDVRENDDMISFVLEDKSGDRYYHNVPDYFDRGKDFCEIATIVPGDEVKYNGEGVHKIK